MNSSGYHTDCSEIGCKVFKQGYEAQCRPPRRSVIVVFSGPVRNPGVPIQKRDNHEKCNEAKPPCIHPDYPAILSCNVVYQSNLGSAQDRTANYMYRLMAKGRINV